MTPEGQNTSRELNADNISGDSRRLAEIYGEAELPADDFTLESILAEYKGSAYIDGDKRTPSSVLQKKTEKIVKEVAGDKPGNGRPEQQAAKPVREVPGGSTIRLPSLDDVNFAKRLEYRTEKAKDVANSDSSQDKTEKEVISLNKYRSAADDGAVGVEVNRAIEEQTLFEEETSKSVRKAFGLFNRSSDEADDISLADDPEALPDEPELLIEEENFEEPDYKTAVKRFAEKCNSYSLKSFASLVLTIILTILTIVFQSKANLPFGLSNNKVMCVGILLILQFIVMMFSADRLINGISDLFKGSQGIDTLNVFSCLAVAAAGFYSMLTNDASAGMPYSAVAAFSLTFTLWGEKIYYRALTETLKTALAVAIPYGVIAELNKNINRTIIRKVSARTAGFYNNLIQADISETAFRYTVPILVVASIVLSLYSSFGHGQGSYFLHILAAIMAAAAPFSAIFAFSVPFNTVTRRARKSGAAVAGWGGADELLHNDGASITDEDLFPVGTISIAGIKIFEEVSPEKAMRYTGSLIIASNSGLSKLFSEHMSKQGMNLVKVEDFACYEGGIGGSIKGEAVITGSAAFMNLMGIRVPTSLNMKNAIFTAVNKKLIAVFTINYIPVKSVQNALVSVLRYHVKLFFAIRDFSITPVMLEQKFKVPVDDVEYIPIQNSYDISDDSKHEAKRVSAILTREGMGPYVEAITGGRRLRLTALIATIVSIISAVGGMLIMFAICWAGSFSAASAGNLLLYMMSMLVIVLIVCGFAKYRQ